MSYEKIIIDQGKKFMCMGGFTIILICCANNIICVPRAKKIFICGAMVRCQATREVWVELVDDYINSFLESQLFQFTCGGMNVKVMPLINY